MVMVRFLLASRRVCDLQTRHAAFHAALGRSLMRILPGGVRLT
jgi:hypothetical protein